MVYESYPAGEELEVFLTRPAFEPVLYRHVKRQTLYLVVSDGEYHLNTFSYEGELHEFPHNGKMQAAEFQFSGGAADESGRLSKYAGPIVVYVGTDGKYWMRPKFEFHDGRFVKEETCSG